jgi:hypothetical protein
VPGDLSPAEKRLVELAQRGVAWEPVGDSPADPAEGDRWGPERILSAALIADLVTGAGPAVHPKGVRIRGARIAGDLDLESAYLTVPLYLQACSFESPLVLVDAHARTVNLAGSHLPGLRARGISVDGDLVLDGVRSPYAVLARATVMGAIWARRASLVAVQGQRQLALDGDGASVDGTVYLTEGFKASGGVRFAGARIGGLDCTQARFAPAEDAAVALNVSQAHVSGFVTFAGGFESAGTVDLTATRIDRDFTVTGARLEGAGDALRGDRLEIGGSALLRQDVEAAGAIRLVDAKIAGDLVVQGARITAPVALAAYGIRVEESIRFDSTRFEGGVDLRAASVRGRLEAPNTSVTGDSEAVAAVDAERMEVRGDVVLRPGFTCRGGVRLVAATIGGNLDCYGGAFDHPDGVAFSIESARIGGQLTWGMLAHTPDGDVDFRAARTHLLRDSRNAWPVQPYQMLLDGFVFDGFSDERQWTPEERIDLVRAQQRRLAGFRPQPYDQLARVYASIGDEVSAQRIRVARQRDLRRFGNLSWPRLFASWMLDLSIEYGYSAWRPVLASIVVLLVGWGVFWSAGDSGAMRPKSLPESEEYSALVYTVDAFLPLIDLSQDSHFVPVSSTTVAIAGFDVDSGWVQRYRWVHKALGLILTALVATALVIQLRR